MRRVPEQLAVYESDTSYTAAPDDVIAYEEGRRRVIEGRADFVNHGKAIRMRRAVLLAGSVECNKRFIDKFATSQTDGKISSYGA